MRILLASASPKRWQLLTSLGHEVIVKPADVVELFELLGSNKEEVAFINARLKAHNIFSRYGLLDCDFVLGADTVALLDHEILGKPIDKAHAREMIGKLSGRTHTTVTGYCLIGKNGHELSRLVKSQVVLRKLDDDEISAYLATDDWQDKAGAYGIQGAGASLVNEVQGSITNVMGLPLEEMLEDARRLIGTR